MTEQSSDPVQPNSQMAAMLLDLNQQTTMLAITLGMVIDSMRESSPTEREKIRERLLPILQNFVNANAMQERSTDLLRLLLTSMDAKLEEGKIDQL